MSPSPIPKPWESVDPSPLPEEQSAWLDDVLGYAELLDHQDAEADALSMQKAASLEALYQSMTWVEEWNTARPPKPDAVGRPVDPQSRNRFTQWLAWRAEKSGRRSLASRRVYQLLTARETQTYLNNVQISQSLTESQLRPLGFFLKAKQTDKIADVEKILANLDHIDAKAVAKAAREVKATMGQRSLDKAKAVTRSRPIRKECEDDFLRLWKQGGPEETIAFVKWAADYIKSQAKPGLRVVS